MGREIIKAIKTEHGGTMFRSLLEATWAHQFDSCDIKWLYEPVTFNLGRISGGTMQRYTPDFYLPEASAYVEIKPTEPTEEEYFRAGQVCDLLGPVLFFLVGEPGDHYGCSPRKFEPVGRYGFSEAKAGEMPYNL